MPANQEKLPKKVGLSGFQIGQASEAPLKNIMEEEPHSFVKSKGIAYVNQVGNLGIRSRIIPVSEEGHSWDTTPDEILKNIPPIIFTDEPRTKQVKPDLYKKKVTQADIEELLKQKFPVKKEEIIYIDSASKDSRTWGTRPPKP